MMDRKYNKENEVKNDNELYIAKLIKNKIEFNGEHKGRMFFNIFINNTIIQVAYEDNNVRSAVNMYENIKNENGAITWKDIRKIKKIKDEKIIAELHNFIVNYLNKNTKFIKLDGKKKLYI